MAHEDGQIYWYDPDPRAILPLDSFYIPRSLRRTLKKRKFDIRINTAFAQVITECAAPAPGREQTWISPEIMDAYIKLHQIGFAHSVEAWHDGQLVGGLYGVAINGFFAGESMFSRMRDASKVALVFLVERLRTQGYMLLDIQFLTDHLSRFGAIEIPRSLYKHRLAQALRVSARFEDVS